jgi:nucleoside-diphosphate-sugar epimerase
MNQSPGLPQRDLEYIVAQTRPLWDAVRGETFFVTGGTGFVGHWMLGSLLAASDTLRLGLRATVLSRRPRAFAARSPELGRHPAVTLIRGDIASFDYPASTHPYILHLAKEPDPVSGAAAPGTARVLDFAASHGGRSLLFTSSGAVYGPQPADCSRLGEHHPPTASGDDPNAAYAQGKREAEGLCLAAESPDFAVKIARCFTFVGPFMDFDGGYAAGNFIRDAVRGEAVWVEGDGSPLRSYLYAADLAVWLWTVFFSGESGTPYNVGSPETISIVDLARLVARRAGRGASVHVDRHQPADGAAPRYVPDTRLASSRLGLTVGIPLEEALDRTAEWYRSVS